MTGENVTRSVYKTNSGHLGYKIWPVNDCLHDVCKVRNSFVAIMTSSRSTWTDKASCLPRWSWAWSQLLRCHLEHLHPPFEYLGISPWSDTISSFLLMLTWGSRWWFKSMDFWRFEWSFNKHTLEIWMEFPALWLWLGPSLGAEGIWEVNQCIEAISIFVPLQ